MDDAQAEKMFLSIILEASKPIVSLKLSDSSSSSSSSDSDSDMVYRKRRICTKNYVEHTIPNYSDEEFKKLFRINRSIALQIIELFRTIVSKNPGGWPKVNADKICYMTVWYLSNQETFRQIGDRFDVSRGCAYKIIGKACALLREKAPDYVKWPNESNKKKISKQFKQKQGIENVIGAINGLHISIKKPHENGYEYINRNGYASILLQAVADTNLKFININVGEPGFLPNARMLHRSVLHKMAENDEQNVFKGYFLLGDSSYPSLNWLIPPYKDNGNLTNNQKEFNRKHSSTRIVIKKTFALLKGRFRRLNHFENTNLKFIIDCVIAACVLHNICQSENDNGEDFIQVGNNDDDVEDLDTDLRNTSNRRDLIFQEMFSCK